MKRLIPTSLFPLVFCISVFSQEAKQFDEFGDLYCDDYLARMDYPRNEVKNNPSSTMYVLVYEGKERKNDKLTLPAFGQARARIHSMKELIKRFWTNGEEVPVGRFKFVHAGFRENFTVEFWLIPKGATPPKPTPTLTKMKYRRGKATGFCLGCCGP